LAWKEAEEMTGWKYNPPGMLKLLFPEFRWNTSNDKILITFDDGPVAGNTEKILKYLDKQKIKSLFFCIGENIKKEPGLAKELISAGHEIGNHTIDHQIITKLKSGQIIEKIKSVNNLSQEFLNYNMNYFRPPHGRFDLRTGRILKQLDLINVMWSLVTFDYKNNFSGVKYSIDRCLQKNSIVVFHDNLKSADIILDSLKYLVDKSEEKGVEVGEPVECLR
jgi:peptidoglycan/xylan/chitin deacetylase (PgdA/CDA1 family)